MHLLFARLHHVLCREGYDRAERMRVRTDSSGGKVPADGNDYGKKDMDRETKMRLLQALDESKERTINDPPACICSDDRTTTPLLA